MNHRCSSAVQIAVGVVLGCAFSSFYEKTFAAPSAAVELGTEDQSKEVLAELKEINTHVKSIDTLLKSGRLKVVPVVNIVDDKGQALGDRKKRADPQ